MNARFHCRATMRLVVSWILIALIPLYGQAQQQVPPLNKHAKKIQKSLAKYPSGSFLHIFLRDHTDRFGNLGTLSETSFEFTDANTAATTTISYDDVDHVTPGSSAQAKIGGRPRHRSALGFFVIMGVAVGVAIGAIAASRN
jgi:hypothetical protein